jgi:histidinol dehydrogenase
MFSIRWLVHDQPNFQHEVEALRLLLRGGSLTANDEKNDLDVPAIVRELIEQVRAGGNRAVAALTSRLDRTELGPDDLLVAPSLLEQAHAQVDAGLMKVVRQAIDNVRAYQKHIKVQAPPPLQRGGRSLGVRYTPIDRVGVYVPGARALYPSTVVMSVVPAQVAGVREIVMVSPPTGGSINPLALALAHELGLREVVQAGGAVGVAALALGTETIRPVHKIVGPGNAFVAEAKRQLFGTVGIDSIAGPSEVFIVADDSAPAEWVAADLLAQAEHNPGSAILATPSAHLAQAVRRALETQLLALARADAARAALEHYSGIIVTRDLAQATELANLFATEHLQLMTSDDAACLQRIEHAGAIFVGSRTPVPLGDYYAGPSHVLPTGGTAHFSGPLSVNDFLKASSIVSYTADALVADAPGVIDFARHEGLTAHAAAVQMRLRGSDP